MFTDLIFRLTIDDPTFEFYKKGVMEYILEYPKSNENWFRLFIEVVKNRLTKKQFREFENNELLIN